MVHKPPKQLHVASGWGVGGVVCKEPGLRLLAAKQSDMPVLTSQPEATKTDNVI